MHLRKGSARMDAVKDSYEHYREEDRLSTNNARRIEWITTVRAFRELFPPNGKILDCAAGTGAYAFYFAQKGYDVTATDLTPRHIGYIRNHLEGKPYHIGTGVRDAADLSCFENETFDIVLCMGPFYHITEERVRRKCLAECLRVLKAGGLLAVAYISRFFVFPYVASSDTRYLNAELAEKLRETGALVHDDPLCFWTDNYFAAPEEMERLFTDAGLQTVDHFAQDGISPFLREKVDAFSAEQFSVWCDYHYAVCREKSILGAGNHALIVGRKQGGAPFERA